LGKYNEKLDYLDDKMGNLKALTRYENGALVENLSLTYQGNQLQKVDNSPSHYVAYGSELFRDYDNHIAIPREYAYDTNGNMSYDAGGQKLRVINYSSNNILDIPMGTITPLSSTPTDYTVLTTDYVGNMIYENGALKEILMPEGFYQNGTFYYYLKDHLGDNRVTINSSGTVVEKSHYYPSGTRFYTESTNNTTAIPYRYSGKEMETMNGLNQMDFGSRRRFSWAPIWTGRDPQSETHYSESSYSFCANSPMNFIDPDGENYIIYLDYENGKLKGVTISATIYITGPNIENQKQGDKMASDLNKEAAGVFKGNKNVTFDVNYEYRANVDKSKLGAGENVLTYSDKTNSDANSKVDQPGSNNCIPMAGNSGTIYANYKNMNRTALHETGHLLGLPEGYFNKYTTSNPDGPTETEARLGYDNDIIMHSINGRGPRGFNDMYYQKYWGKANLHIYTGHPQVNCTKQIGYNPKGVLNNNSYSDGLEPYDGQIKP